LAKHLDGQRIAAMAIHGNKSQSAREKALSLFKSGRIRVLVATDIAARGLDIADLPHVVNYELPNIPEDYVHRIGRTGRAGKAGQAVSLVSDVEEGYLWDIEKLLKKEILRYKLNEAGEKVPVAKPATRSALKRPAPGQNNQRRGGGGGKRRAQTGKPKAPQDGGGRHDNRRSRGRNR
jgi:ATP-dependent RNA helicase RhlE